MTAHYLVPLELHARGDSILGSLAGRTSGSVNFANLRATAHWGVRTVGSAADGVGAGRYKLAMGVEGRVTVEQYGREAILLPGQLAIYDTSDDYRVGSSQRFGVLITMIRADVLDLPPARVAALSATTLPEDCAAALKPLILDPLHDDSRLEPALAAISQTLRRTAPSVRRSIRDHDLAGEALEVIEERLADARLSPGFLAARLGVSRRRLYQACAAEIGPVAGYIRVGDWRPHGSCLDHLSSRDTPWQKSLPMWASRMTPTSTDCSRASTASPRSLPNHRTRILTDRSGQTRPNGRPCSSRMTASRTAS